MVNNSATSTSWTSCRHVLTGAYPDQIGFKLGTNLQNFEEGLSRWMGRVVNAGVRHLKIWDFVRREITEAVAYLVMMFTRRVAAEISSLSGSYFV